MGENGDINQYQDLSHITNIAKGQTAKPDAGPAIGKMILKHLPSYEAENDELGYDPQDFQTARNIANIYITKGERAGLQAQGDSEVSEMIDELLSDAGASGLRTIWDLKEQGMAESIQHKKITELFDAKTSFPLKWDTQFASKGEVHAEAYDADGRTIDISFTPTGYGHGIEIVFKRGGSYDMTGHGDAPRVLATVVNAISQYLQKYQPPYIAFSAKSTGGRAGAYAAMIRRLARGYTLLTPDEYPEDTEGFLDFLGRDIPFILARNAKMDTKGVAEDAAGVGVIAKNKKMARDPRYSMSITKDVQPGQDKKNLQAWHLIKK
jgi:hypothetical protein